MQYFTGISRNAQSKSYMLSLTECVWELQNNALWDTHYHAIVANKFYLKILGINQSCSYFCNKQKSIHKCLEKGLRTAKTQVKHRSGYEVLSTEREWFAVSTDEPGIHIGI